MDFSNVYSFVTTKIEPSFPWITDYITLIIVLIILPSLISLIKKQFDKNHPAKGSAPALFIALFIISIMYIFTYRSLSKVNEIYVLQDVNKSKIAFLNKSQYGEYKKDNVDYEFSDFDILEIPVGVKFELKDYKSEHDFKGHLKGNQLVYERDAEEHQLLNSISSDYWGTFDVISEKDMKEILKIISS